MPLKAEKIGYYHVKGQWIFRDFNLQIEPGERVGLIGPSGCGKTTLAKVLTGFLHPKEGRITQGSATLTKQGWNPVQMVFQHPEKAVNPRWRLKNTLQEAGVEQKALMEQLGIEPVWLNRYPNELSGGELQRFCLARALNPQTQYLIADEITTMLDAVSQAQIWHTILDIAQKRNLGLLVISHDKHLMERVVDRIVSV